MSDVNNNATVGRDVFRPRPSDLRHGWVAILFGLLGTRLAAAEPAQDLGWMSLEQLGQINVVTASKHKQPVWTTPAALSLITADDIRLAGANSIPEALRLAPGVDVARINSQRYAVSIRGFASEFGGTLLVLQDGRSLFSPQFNGVFWDAQDTDLSDLDRIEVVRGPGGTAWGVNAMNGVVNILTKDASDTQGVQVTAGGGTLERAYATLRYGGQLSERSHFRVYARTLGRGETEFVSGQGAGDDWKQTRGGFRSDTRLTGDDHFTLQGDIYSGRLLQYTSRVPDLFRSTGANLLGRLTRELPGGATLQLLSYYDYVRRNTAPATAHSDTYFAEANYRAPWAQRHTASWVGTYQVTRTEAVGRVGHNYDPVNRRLKQISLSVSDDYVVRENRAMLTLGAKGEYNEFTGWEVLPSLRMTWTPDELRTGWIAVSRGLQTPDISSYDLTIDIAGNPNVKSIPNRDRPASEVKAAEAGWRVTLNPALTVDATGFFDRYDRLGSSTSMFDVGSNTLTVVSRNDVYGESYGFEVAALWEPAPHWQVRASYSSLEMQFHTRPGSNDTSTAVRNEAMSPKAQWKLTSVATLGGRWDISTGLRFVGDRRSVPDYLGLDLRFAYRPAAGVEVYLSGKDLLDPRHLEFTRSAGFPANTEVPRSLQLGVTWNH